MELKCPPLETEHPPHAASNIDRNGRPLSRIFLRTILFLVIFISFFNLPHLTSGIQDLHPGLRDFIPGLRNERERRIGEILSVIEKWPTDLAGATRAQLAEVIYEEAVRHNYDPKFVLALIAIESSFQNRAVSERGAKGLMQIMPFVAESIAPKLGIEWRGDQTLFNPFLNIKMGLHYFSELILDFSDVRLALTAYNYGPTYVRSLIENERHIPLQYAQRVLEVYRNI